MTKKFCDRCKEECKQPTILIMTIPTIFPAQQTLPQESMGEYCRNCIDEIKRFANTTPPTYIR